MWRRAENARERRAFPMRPSSLSFSGRSDGRFRTLVSAAKNPVPGAEKVWWREFRPGAVAAGCALRLKSANVMKWNQGWARPSLSLPKTISERIDGVVRQGSDTQQCSRSARSAVYKARPSQAKCASARHYNRSRISQEFVASARR